MNIDTIRQLIRARRYQIKLHAVQHALQEGFGEKEMIAAILTGLIVETYPERNRVLICGKAMFDVGMELYLHVVCEQNYPDQVELITAYIPSKHEWGTPPLKRKKNR
ncbi:MAG: DUF4258 domain-containing protein [Caldilinea sp. CFX5]|nr:DUF4258 domain-containing protein [Caldilinea sp. CFX5]